MGRKIAFAIYLVVCAALIAFLLSMRSDAVRVTSDADQEQVPPRPPGPPMPPVPPTPMPPGALQRLIGRVTIEGPYSDRGLTVFTLAARTPENHVNYLTLDEGTGSGQLIVQEVSEGSVPTLMVQNRSARWAFLMSGELVAGGKQNRTLRSDSLVPPNTTAWLNLPVYCVEQHRWSAPSRFDSAKAAAPNALRSGLNQGYDQGRVWEEASRAQKAAGVESRTGDVTVLYTDAKTAGQIEEIAGALIRRIPRREYVGLVVAQGGRIVSADLFANSSLYSRLYEKVIRSHVVEVLGKEYVGYPAESQVREFLNRIYGAHSSVRPAPNGYGQTVSIQGNGLGGESLEFSGQCVHAALFTQLIRPIPLPEPMPRNERTR